MRGRFLIALLILITLVGIVNAGTLIVNPTADGEIRKASANSTWVNISGGTASDAATTGATAETESYASSSTGSGLFHQYKIGVLSFNTSDLPDDATIDSASLMLNVNTKSNYNGEYTLAITNCSLTTNGSIVVGDWTKRGNLEVVNRISYASITASNTNNTFNFNTAGLGWISKTAYTNLNTRLGWDVDGSYNATWSWGYSSFTWNTVDHATTGYRPFLTIAYTAGGDTTPPASISGLSNSTLCNSINWTWTNPTDADLNHTMIYQNGAFLHNVSNSTTFDLWESLSELTEYAFASKTCDITGNCNLTFQNQSAITTSCEDTTPPASISGLSNVTTCNQISWSWSNPTDPDFNHTVIYQNGTFLHNVSNATTTDVWSGLAELTEYIFSSYTCDITGNCNTTWQNLSSTTLQCGIDPPIASFISNTTCGNVPFAVLFNDTSLYTPTSWNWSFGDGGYSEEQNPVYTYSTAGLWSINFNATNDYGTNWSNVTGYIRAVPDWATCPATPTPTPAWTPVIMPSTEFDVNPTLFNYWWIGAILISMIVVFKKW